MLGIKWTAMGAGKLYYLVFFISGAAGLVYEIVWSRELLLILGNTTYAVSAVVSAFMAGLGIGSLVFGVVADKAKNLVRTYAWLELGVAAGAGLFQIGRPVMESVYPEWAGGVEQAYLQLGIKFLMAALLMLPATICMGGTLPVMVKFFSKKGENPAINVSKLYFVNTLGAFFGVVVTGFLLIESFGLEPTSNLAVVTNLLLGASMLIVSSRMKSKTEEKTKEERLKFYSGATERFEKILIVFGVSGFVAMAYQILWVRLLIPSVGTMVYAFALILGTYLLGIAIGSYAFEKLVGNYKDTNRVLALLEAGIGICAVFSVIVLTRIGGLGPESVLGLAIFPGALFMGMTFPVAVEAVKKIGGVGREVGKLYVGNTIGSVLGTLAAPFVLIPFFGSARSILVLALVNFLLVAVLIWRDKNLQLKRLKWIVVGMIMLGGLGSWKIEDYQLLPVNLRVRLDKLKDMGQATIVTREDEVASVVSAKSEDGKIRWLLIDGVLTTTIQAETALMAYLPTVLHSQPKDMLIIALGMGNTYRSALLRPDLNVKVVELVPSVPLMLKYFHDDYAEFATDPRGKIVVNDGRNYLKTAKESYDIMIVDPPPPVNSSGTTILYSKEFYADAKKLMKPDGIFLSWFFNDTRADDYKMLIRSFYESFPNILVVESPCKCGYFLLGSEKNLVWDEQKIRQGLNERILQNINKGRSETERLETEDILKLYVGDETGVKKYTQGFPAVTDLFPRTEYFNLRWGDEKYPAAAAQPLTN